MDGETEIFLGNLRGNVPAVFSGETGIRGCWDIKAGACIWIPSDASMCRSMSDDSQTMRRPMSDDASGDASSDNLSISRHM